MAYCTYILYSAVKNRYYIGFTGDVLEERIRRHNSTHHGFTGGTGDWIVVYTEYFPDKLSAMKREKEIKAWKSSIKIKKLIGLKHPD